MPNGVPDVCRPIAERCQQLEGDVADIQADIEDCRQDPHCRVGPLVQRLQAARRRLAACRAELNRCIAENSSNLRIAGIEMTQATQYFSFNGQGSGLPFRDNAVPPVADKTMILRVYVDRTTLPQFPIPNTISGQVTYAGHPDLFPINAPITAMASTAINRGNANHTLNFRVPAGHCTGSVSFTVRVFDPARPGDRAASSAPQTFFVQFDPVPQVRIRGFLINFTDSITGTNFPPPISDALVNTLVFPGRVFPISGFNVTAFEQLNFTGDLRPAPVGGGCGSGWDALWGQLNTRHASDGASPLEKYVGLLPAGVPTGATTGCGGGNAAVAFVNNGPVMAQEIRHAFGQLLHAPCPAGQPDADPSYPNCRPGVFPAGSICEFGFDSETSAVFNPLTTFDYMSQCAPRWTSPYTYSQLKINITTSSASSLAAAGPLPAEVRSVEREYLHLSFRMYRDGKVELLPSFHLHGSTPAPPVGTPSPISLDLWDSDERTIVFHRCYFITHQDPEGSYLEFHEALPWESEAHSIVFFRDGEKVHTHRIEERPPEVREVSIRAPDGEEAPVRRVAWRGQHPEEGRSLTYLLRYSNDGGDTWRTVVADLSESGYDVDLDSLPGGEECAFQVVASSGIRTVVTPTEFFAVPQKPRKAMILSPSADAIFTQGEQVVLRGIGFSPDFETAEFRDMVWNSNLEGVIGIGYEVITQALSVGRHRITLSIPDGLGEVASSGVFIEIEPRGE